MAGSKSDGAEKMKRQSLVCGESWGGTDLGETKMQLMSDEDMMWRHCMLQVSWASFVGFWAIAVKGSWSHTLMGPKKKNKKKTCLLVNIDKLLYGYELWYSVWLWIVIFCISGFRSPVRRVWWLGANEYVKAACGIPLPANQGVTAPFCEGLGKVERHPVFVQTWRGPSRLVSISIYSISHSTHI